MPPAPPQPCPPRHLLLEGQLCPGTGRGGHTDGGHMLMAKEKRRELYGNSDVAVVFRRGL